MQAERTVRNAVLGPAGGGEGGTLRKASMFFPQARQRSQEGLYRRFHQLSAFEKCWLGPKAVYSPLTIW